MTIRTAGELRAFLADVLIGIKAGDIDVTEASAIAKVAAQINQSLAVECSTAIALRRMGEDGHVAGSMQIASAEPEAIQPKTVWCDQCDALVGLDEAAGCKSRYCSVRKAA